MKSRVEETGRRRVEKDAFIRFAADVLGVAAETLSLETTYASIPEWDSMAQLRLVVECAERFGVEIPFADVVSVTSLWEFLRRLNGEPLKKAVAVDLDGTLWEGVVGEDGAEALRPNVALLEKLRDLKERGVLLAILSKNNPEDARAGLARQTVLAADDFVAMRVDWKDKAENLASLAAELNLGTDAFVFVDDNPAERFAMSARLPDVAVANFPPALDAYFPDRPLTDEDRRKTEEYRAEARRKAFLRDVGTDAIASALGVVTDVHVLRDGEVARVAQLSQKANQFNVRTNRYDGDGVRRLASEGLVLTAHARDRFGDQGLVGYAIAANGEIVDFVLSCRAMGRGIEDRLSRELERTLAARGVREIRATYRMTAKNAPVRELFDRLGYALVEATPSVRSYRKELTP